MWAEAMDPVEMVDDDELYIPWFLDCNRERFPYWFGKEDSRYQNFLNRMKEVKQSFHFPEKRKRPDICFQEYTQQTQVTKQTFYLYFQIND